jgi:hypothetical protein
MNNGRILDAANGLYIWRKSEIDGNIYVVDALMRRRTAEKALFLRPEGRPVKASGADLPPIEDETLAELSTDDGLPVFTNDDRAGVVSVAPYNLAPPQTRRREDGPAGILTLSEVFDDEGRFETEIDISGEDAPKSPIAVAAEGLSDRLDALIGEVREGSPRARNEIVSDETWPESLIQAETTPTDTDDNKVVPFKSRRKGDVEVPKVDIVIDNLREDDAMHVHDYLENDEDSASKYIETNTVSEDKNTGSGLPYWIMIILGSILLGASVAVLRKGGEALLGQYGPLLATSGVFIGAMMFIGALYYALRHSVR